MLATKGWVSRSEVKTLLDGCGDSPLLQRLRQELSDLDWRILTHESDDDYRWRYLDADQRKLASLALQVEAEDRRCRGWTGDDAQEGG